MQKLFAFEKKCLNFITENYKIIFIIIITFLALIIRYFMLDFMSGDYVNFLSQWFDYLKDNGGLSALKSYPGDYNAPYMTLMAILTYIPLPKLYLIKSISILFDFLLALFGGILVKNCVNKNKTEKGILTYFILLFLPNMLMNSAMWAQCDSIYTCFIVLSLIFLLKEKYSISFIMLGISFAFKLQFIFILPLYVMIYVTKKNFSILNFLLIPLVNIILCIPSMIFGKSFMSCLMIYFNQTQTYNQHLVLNFPNIYNLLSGNIEMLFKVGEILTIVIFAIVLFYLIYKKVKWNNQKILNMAVWVIVIATFFMPSMHERYLFAGEILSIIYFIIYKKNGLLSFFINFVALLTYSSYIFGFNFQYMQLTSIIFTFIIIMYTKNVLESVVENNEKA